MQTDRIGQFNATDNGASGTWGRGRSADPRSLVVLLAVLVAVLGGAGAVTGVFSGPSAAGAAAQTQAPDAAIASVPYFPSLYVNQATKIEEQPPTF
jgi:hypothetical protein